MPNNPDTAAQVARLREMAARFKHDADINRDDASSVRNGHVLRLYVEQLDGYASDVTAAADALEREAWCEERKVDVRYSYERQEWTVEREIALARYAHKTAPTRKAAIDAARGGGK
jgi:hypothetical protein